jgi:imidazolonepropionase-like amidohydrolase
MTRTVLHGGRIFDGTGSPIASGDVAIEDGLIADVGIGLDGDEQVEVSGSTLLPGLFDCHVHVTMSGISLMRAIQSRASAPISSWSTGTRSTLLP